MASRNLGSLTVDLLLKMGGFKQGMDAAARETDRATRRISQNAKRVTSEFTRMGASLVAGFASVATVRQFIQINDEYKRLEGRLRLVTSSAEDLRRVQSSLFDVAQRTRTEYTSVADLYVRLAQTSAELGASQQDLLRFSEGVGNALTISGTSAMQARGALIQLSQALGGGIVRAEEFNSVLEGAPEIIRTVAKNIDGVDGSIAKLRVAVNEGRISSETFFKAFLAGSDELADKAQSLPVTVGQAFTRLKNIINQAIAGADTGPLVDSINSLSQIVSDPGFQQSFSSFVAGVVRLASLTFRGFDALVRGVKSVAEDVARITSGPDDIIELQQKRLNDLLGKRQALLRTIRDYEQSGIQGGTIEKFRSDLVALEFQINQVNTELKTWGQPGGGAPSAGAAAPASQRLRLAAPTTRGAGNAEATRAAREAAEAIQDQAKAYEDVYTKGLAAIEGLRTPLEEQLASYHEQRYALEQLAATYPNLADEAGEALKRLTMDGLEPITITAEKIFPPQEREELNVFFEEASRGFQNLLADFLFDPFKDGLRGMLQGFGDMLQRMAAEAVAAQIAQKLFGTGVGTGTGSSAGWLQMAGNLFMSYWGGSGTMNSQGIGLTSSQISQAFKGLSDGGYTGDGGKYQPAGIVHAGEFVTRSEVTRQPGAVPFLESFNRVGMAALQALPGFASGGLVSPAIVPAAGPRTPRAGGMSVSNYFTIQAPNGTVSRATETQIAAAAARGAARANARNN
jgi:tape measure domain-containing protein